LAILAPPEIPRREQLLPFAEIDIGHEFVNFAPELLAFVVIKHLE